MTLSDLQNFQRLRALAASRLYNCCIFATKKFDETMEIEEALTVLDDDVTQ